MLYVGAIAALGFDVEQIEFTMPDTSHARVVDDGDRLNWVVKGEP